MTAATNALTVVRPLVLVADNAAEVDSGLSITSTNVSDADTPAWNSATTYQLGDMVHLNYKTYKCVLIHVNISPEAEGALTASPPIWQRVGWTNSRKPFDNSSTSQASNASTISYVINSNNACTHLAVLGMLDATSVRVRVRRPSDLAILYDQTVSLTANNKLVSDQVFSGLSTIAPADFMVDISGGSSLAVSTILFGAGSQVGMGIHHGANIQFQDYSRKEVDDFGEVTFVRRAFAKRATFDTTVERADIDGVMALLASLRARPCLWIGHPNYQSTAIYGFFKDLSINLAYASRALLSISIEGLPSRGPVDEPLIPAPPAPAPSPSPSPSPSPAPSPAPEWTPQQIFTTGVNGAWLEPLLNTLETTATSGNAITQVGDRVGKWLDLSGNGHHVSQTTDASRPYFQYAAGNLPCVDYYNQLGMASTTGGSTTAGTYGCIGIEIATTTGAVWSNVNAGSTSGIRIVYASADGGITLVAGTGAGTVSLFQTMPNPPGKCVIQWWHDTAAGTINMRVNDNTVKSATLSTMGAGLASFGLGRYPDGGNVFNQKIFCHLHTVDHLPSQSNRDQAYTWARKLSGMAESNTDTSTGTFPAKVLGCYYQTYATSTYKITDVPMDFNVIYLFHCKPGQSGGTALATYNATHGYTNQGDGSWFFEHYTGVPSSAIQQCRNRGQKVILTLGGAGAGFIYAQDPAVSTTQRTAAWNSIQSIITNLGGVDGIDFNNYEGRNPDTLTDYLNSGNVANFKANMLWIAQQARTAYGNDFAITSPPGAINTGGSPVNGIAMNSSHHLDVMGHLADAGVLTYAAPQYYDWSFYNQSGSISGVNQQWVARLGATRTALGLSANYANGPSLSDCIREWDAVKAAYPNIRGMFCWNAQTNLSGGNVWGSTMKARL